MFATLFHCAALLSPASLSGQIRWYEHRNVLRASLHAVPSIETRLKIFHDTAAQRNNYNASVHYDTICPNGNKLFAIRSDLSRQLLKHRHREENGSSVCISVQFVSLLTTVFRYFMICPHSCQTCP